MRPDPKYYAELAGNVADALAFAAPCDVNEHGEVQPRLPGPVGAVRDLELAITSAELPYMLTPPTNERSSFTPSLFSGCDAGDWERKTGRRSARP